jgi:predicted DCC family thiol-disulfide oxidoreductase YuxK
MTKVEASVSSSRSTAAEAANHASVSVCATEAGHPVIFFDGVCGLCNRFVDFVIRHDRQGVFRLAPLQGETARDRLAEADVVDLKTVVLVDTSGTYRKSTAVLRVLGRLGTFWKIVAALLWVIPRPIRDLGYSWIAANRYAIFGRKETCRLPSAGERERFLS